MRQHGSLSIADGTTAQLPNRRKKTLRDSIHHASPSSCPHPTHSPIPPHHNPHRVSQHRRTNSVSTPSLTLTPPDLSGTRTSRALGNQMSTMLRLIAVTGMLAIEHAGAANTASPNKAIAKPGCDSSIPVSFRYSSKSAGLYVESADGTTRGGCVTLKAIWEGLGSSAPVYAVDSGTGDVSHTATGTWLLTESLYVEDGITLQVTG